MFRMAGWLSEGGWNAINYAQHTGKSKHGSATIGHAYASESVLFK
jgi:hypothetical protein